LHQGTYTRYKIACQVLFDDEGTVKKKSEISQEIEKLRKSLGMNQAQFAAGIDASQAAVSLWETGEGEPSGETCLKLGNLAPFPLQLWFWEQAGLDMQKLSEAATELAKTAMKDLIAPDVKFFAIKPHPEAVEGDRPELILPASVIPNPPSTSFLVIDQKFAGSGFTPGDIVVVESSRGDVADLVTFESRILLVQFGPRSETGNPYWPEGFFLGRFRIRGHGEDPLVYVASIGPANDLDPRWSFYSQEGKYLLGSWRHPGISKEPAQGSPREQISAEIGKIDARLREIAEEGYKLASTRYQTEEEVELEKAAADAGNRLRHEEERERKAAEEDAKEQGPHSVRLKPGCRILGWVIAWFPAPPEKK
jgi:DNA-binding XRE family transcriptional regulator